MTSYDPAFRQRDALLHVTKSFPTAANGVTATEAFDLGPLTPFGIRPGNMELILSAPELNLPDGAKMTYALEFCDDGEFAVEKVTKHLCSDWAQTGSAEGAEDMVRRFRLSTDAKQFVRMTCTKTGTGGTVTGKTFSLEIVT